MGNGGDHTVIMEAQKIVGTWRSDSPLSLVISEERQKKACVSKTAISLAWLKRGREGGRPGVRRKEIGFEEEGDPRLLVA